MELERARLYLKDETYTNFNPNVREALRVTLEYVKELENKIIELEKTKEK